MVDLMSRDTWGCYKPLDLFEAPDGGGSQGSVFGQEPWVLYPRSDAIHEEKSGEDNGVGKEDIGGPYLPVFFWSEISATPWLLGGPEGNGMLSVV